MLKIPIRVKITLWYSLLLAALLVLCTFTVIRSVRSISDTEAKRNVEECVRESAEEIKFKKNEIKLKDDIEYFDDGVFIQIFDSSLSMLGGYNVKGTEQISEFEPDTLRRVSADGKEWYVYTMRVTGEDGRYVWIRGLTDITGTMRYGYVLYAVIFLLFIAIIALGLVVGYFIAKKLTMPIGEFIKTAGEIHDANDLTKRINVKSNDEIGELATFFNDMLDRLSVSFDRERTFTNDVSHELRTPLAVINSECEYALSQDNNKETQECLIAVKSQTDKMSAMISQLLFLARTENGTQKLNFEPVDYSFVAECAVDDGEVAAGDKNITFIRNIEPDITVTGDQLLLTRLLVNLISNGVKYNKDGGTVEVTVKREGAQVLTIVKDTGIGIAPENINKIWDRFYREDFSRTKDGDDSTGLGLTMVKIIAEAHGGSIRVASVLGQGTVFEFRMPY